MANLKYFFYNIIFPSITTTTIEKMKRQKTSKSRIKEYKFHESLLLFVLILTMCFN